MVENRKPSPLNAIMVTPHRAVSLYTFLLVAEGC